MYIIYILSVLLIFIVSLNAEVKTDTLSCYMSLTPFENGSYYGAYDYYQQDCIGDLNGDGYNDLVIGGKKEGEENGELHIHFGGDLLDSIPNIVIKGEELPVENYKFGNRFVFDGDLNGDGYDDLVVSSTGIFNAPTTGHIFIFLGSRNFDNEPDFILDGSDYSYDPIGFNFGSWLDISGDINGDGINDLLVHSMGPSWYWSGQVDLFFGGENFDTQSDWMSRGEVGKFYGQKVTHGDLDGDGCDEIISIQNKQGSEDGKRVDVYSGGENPSSDIVWSYYFEDIVYDQLNLSLVSGSDINSDGYDDLLLGYSSSDSNINCVKKIFFGDNNEILVDSDLNSFSDYGGYKHFSFYDQNSNGVADISFQGAYTDNNIDWFYEYNIQFGGEDINTEPDLRYIFNNNPYKYTLKIEPIGDINGDNIDDFLIFRTNQDWNINIGIFILKEIVEIDEMTLNDSFSHFLNYPNPFNPTTSIQYSLGGDNISGFLKIFDVMGREIITHKIDQNSGVYQFDGRDLNSGIYTYSIIVDNKVVGSSRMVLIK